MENIELALHVIAKLSPLWGMVLCGAIVTLWLERKE